jgi:TetR/AcrR family transcriptional regulator
MTLTKSRPGRPAAAATTDARQDIIRAACLHYARFGIKGSSNRQIAQEAKVTPAMIHYYFSDKTELYRAVLQTALQPLQETLPQARNLDEWVHSFHRHLLQTPWFPHLMMREVLPQNGLLREQFMAHNAPFLFGSARAVLQKEFRKLKVSRRKDLDRHVVLLVGMLVYPFIGMEIAQNVTGRKFDEHMMNCFRDDALSLFLDGIRP